jgi:hypothetical protein
MGSRGAAHWARGVWTVEGPAPIRRRAETTGTGDVLSVCMMLLDRREEVPLQERLRLANRIVAEFMQGDRRLIPALE